jgi:hypothetical protein
MLKKKYIKKAISQPHIKINAFGVFFYSELSLKKKCCRFLLNNNNTTTNEPYPVTTKKAQ